MKVSNINSFEQPPPLPHDILKYLLPNSPLPYLDNIIFAHPLNDFYIVWKTSWI